MLIQVAILILGFIILIKGADYFVDGASSIAKNLKVPDMLIGLTIVSFGTSAPEAAVSIKAILSQNNDMVIGNVVGSNILNILLILGLAATIAPIKVKNNTIKREIPLLVLVSLLMGVLLLDVPLGSGVSNMISRSDGLVTLIFFCVFLYYLVTLAKKGEVEAVEAKYTLKKAILFTIIGLLAIIIGGDFVVDSATEMATALGVGQRFISLTIVAFGTSLPELVTSVVAAKKGEADLAIGNIIGSNIFNICFVVGLPAAIWGDIIPKETVSLDILVMIFCTIILFIFSWSKKGISRKEGISFLVLFMIYYGYIIVSQISNLIA